MRLSSSDQCTGIELITATEHRQNATSFEAEHQCPVHRQSANPSSQLQVNCACTCSPTCSTVNGKPLLASCWLWSRVGGNAPGHLEKCGEVHSTNQVVSCQACKICAGADAQCLADTCGHHMADSCTTIASMRVCSPSIRKLDDDCWD